MDEGCRIQGYSNLLDEHYKDYASLFNRVKLELNPTVKTSNLPTAQRLKNYRNGQPDYYLESSITSSDAIC